MRMLSPTTTTTTTTTTLITSGETTTSAHSHSYEQQQAQQAHQPQQQLSLTLSPSCRRYPTCPRYPHKHSSLPRPSVRVQLEGELQLEGDSSRSLSRACASTSTGIETTLSQRLRRAIINDDLPAATRVAKAAILLAETWSQRVPPAAQGSVLGSSRARRREWVRQRERLRLLGEECLVPLAAAGGAYQDGETGRERKKLVFDIRNVKTPELEGCSPRTATATTTSNSSSLSYPPLAGSKLPSPPYPLDCIVAKQDARKTSLQLAIEYRCSVEMVEWLLQCGHEELPTATSGQGATLRLTRDDYGRTIFHLAVILDRPDVMQVYYAHVQGRLEEGSFGWSGATDDTSVSKLQDQVEGKQDAQQPEEDVDSNAHEQYGDKGEYEPVDSSKARRCSDSLSRTSAACSSTNNLIESSNTPLLRLINAPDELTAYTALHEAASRGFYDLCHLLLSYGAQIDSLDISGNTPLHLASANGHPTCVHLLIEKGANFGLRNEMGCSPADVAYTDADRATLEAMGRNSVALRKERRKEERMAKAALSSEKARNGAESQSFEGESASASERSFTPETGVASVSGWGRENAFSSLALASSPLPEAARSTSALVTGRTAWFDEDGLEDLLLGSNSPSASVERTSPRSRLASFPRLASRNSTLMTTTAPLSPSAASEGPSGGSAGTGLLDARMLRLARRSSSALRLWAGYGLGRATSPALGSKTTRDTTSIDSYNSSTTADPRTPTSFSFETRSSFGSPKALHVQHFIGHTLQSFRSSATPLGTAASLSSPAAAPSSTSTSSPFTQRSHPSRPFRYLKASRSSTALASAFRQTAAPLPPDGAAQAQAHSHAHMGLDPSGGQDRAQSRSALRVRPRSIDLSSSTSLSLSVRGPSTRGMWTNSGEGVKVATATPLILNLAADDSATEELATPTSPVAELGRELGSRSYEKDKDKRKRNDSGRVEWGQGRGEAYRHCGGGGTSRVEYNDLQQTPEGTEGGLRVARGQTHARSPSIDWRSQYVEGGCDRTNEAHVSQQSASKDTLAHLSNLDANAALRMSTPLKEISTTSISTDTATTPSATLLSSQTQQSGPSCAAVHVQPRDEKEEEDKHSYPLGPAPASAPASGMSTSEAKTCSSVALASYLASTPARPPRRIRDGGREVESSRGSGSASGRHRSGSRSRTRPKTRPSTAGSK